MANDSANRTAIKNKSTTITTTPRVTPSVNSEHKHFPPSSSPENSSTSGSSPSSSSSKVAITSLTTSPQNAVASRIMPELLNSNNMDSQLEPQSATPPKKSSSSSSSSIISDSVSQQNHGTRTALTPSSGNFPPSRVPSNNNANKSFAQDGDHYPMSPAHSNHSSGSASKTQSRGPRSIHSIANDLAIKRNENSMNSAQVSMLESSLRNNASTIASQKSQQQQRQQKQQPSKPNCSQSFRKVTASATSRVPNVLGECETHATPNHHLYPSQQHHQQPPRSHHQNQSLPNNCHDEEEGVGEGDEYDEDMLIHQGHHNLAIGGEEEDTDVAVNENDNEESFEQNNEMAANSADLMLLLNALIPAMSNLASLSGSSPSSALNPNSAVPPPIQNRLSGMNPSQAFLALQSSIQQVANFQNNQLSNLVGVPGVVPALVQAIPEETANVSTIGDGNTIYRGLYPIKEVKEYFTRTVNDEGEKVYSCQFPGCSFQTKQYSQHISRHIYLKHIGIKKELRCRQCEKKFQRPESLVQHEKNHVCGFGIDQDRMNDPANPCGKVNIKKHFRKVTDHEFDVYQCQYGHCKFHTNNSGSIRRHVHNQHICAYGSVNNNNHNNHHSASGSSVNQPIVPNQFASTVTHSGNTSNNNNFPSTGIAGVNLSLSNGLNTSTNSIRSISSLTSSGMSQWPEVQCQLVVGDQEYRPEGSDDSSSQTGIRSDEEEEEPINLAQPICPMRSPLDDNNGEEMAELDGQQSQQASNLFEQFAPDFASFPNFAIPAGSPAQSTGSGSGNKQKNNGLYSLKNYKQYYTKKKTEDGSGYVFVCSICNKFQATQQISLIRHIWTETQHQNFACEFEGCNEEFSSEFARYRHRKTVHHQGQNPPTSSTVGPDLASVPESLQEFAAKLTNQASTSSLDLMKILAAASSDSNKQGAEAQQRKLPKPEQPKPQDQMGFNPNFQFLMQLLNGNSGNVPSASFVNMLQGAGIENELSGISPALLPPRLQRQQQQQQQQQPNQLITKLLNAPSGAFANKFDIDTLSENSSEPPTKRSKQSPKSDNPLSNDSLPGISKTGLDFSDSNLRSALSSTTALEAQQASTSATDANAQAKSKNPAKSGLYSLKAHQERFIRKKKETGNGYEYTCKDCQEYTTSSQASMVRHIWSHGQQDFSCNVCDEHFENEFNLYKHKKALHPEATTQHNRGVKGNSKKQQAQNLKRQQQQQQLLQQKQQKAAQHFQQLRQQQQQPDNSFLRQQQQPEESLLQNSYAPTGGLPEPNLASLMMNHPRELMAQFVEFLQKNQQQQQSQQLGDNILPVGRQQPAVESLLFPMREMSGHQDYDANRVEYGHEADEGVEASEDDEDCGMAMQNSENNVAAGTSSSMLPFPWLQAAMAASEKPSLPRKAPTAGHSPATLPGYSRRASQFKQKGYEKLASAGGKIRTIEEQRSQGDQHFADDEDEDMNGLNIVNDDDDDDGGEIQLNGENGGRFISRNAPASENDTEDEDLNNNNSNDRHVIPPLAGRLNGHKPAPSSTATKRSNWSGKQNSNESFTANSSDKLMFEESPQALDNGNGNTFGLAKLRSKHNSQEQKSVKRQLSTQKSKHDQQQVKNTRQQQQNWQAVDDQEQSSDNSEHDWKIDEEQE